MKRVIASSHSSYWTKKCEGREYGVHYNEVTEDMDSLEAFNTFSASISKISPYDDADYYWAKIEDGTIKYILNGKVRDKSYYVTSDDADLDNIEWVQSIIQDVCSELNELNKNIKPRMVHN